MTLELAPNEETVFTVHLKKSRWKNWRCIQFTGGCVGSILLSPLACLYAFLGCSCRTREADSFEMVLTNRNIHFTQKIYQCGICCQNTQNKTIPLDKIQDILLVSNCCGDTCGFVDKAGDIYQVHIQTAGMGPMPELSVFCIENPQEFKRQVLNAKQQMESRTHISGQSKTAEASQVTTPITQEQHDRLLHVLELMERQLHEKRSPAV